jgi:hypothetical protein
MASGHNSRVGPQPVSQPTSAQPNPTPQITAPQESIYAMRVGFWRSQTLLVRLRTTRIACATAQNACRNDRDGRQRHLTRRRRARDSPQRIGNSCRNDRDTPTRRDDSRRHERDLQPLPAAASRNLQTLELAPTCECAAADQQDGLIIQLNAVIPCAGHELVGDFR